MEFFVISTLNGLSYGLLLFMLSSGLTLIFGIMRVVNFTHGELYAFGAYMMYALVALAERLLGDPVFREQQVEILRAAASAFRWRDAAEGLIDLIDRSLAAPSGRRSVDVVVVAPGRPTLSVRWLERAVSFGKRHPVARRVVVGEGTRRQDAVREYANGLRRRSQSPLPRPAR